MSDGWGRMLALDLDRDQWRARALIAEARVRKLEALLVEVAKMVDGTAMLDSARLKLALRDGET